MTTASGLRVELVHGDITTQDVDAIVNAANSSLLGGGGVDGAIHRAAGPSLLAACREVRRTAYPDGLPVAQAVATTAGALPCRWVIHTVGPNWHAGEQDPQLLAACFENSLAEAARVGARTVAVPAVSAGIYGWDPARVAQIAVASALAYGQKCPHDLDLVRFVLFNEPLLALFRAALAAHEARD